jgi:non-ribosomal peptide synthetase component F
LPALPIQHGDYAAWQQQQMTETSFAEELAFWEENLRGAPELLELPTDRPRPPATTYRGARQRFRLETALAENLRGLSRKEQTSLFTVFAAAFNTLLYRYTGQDDILVGIPMADRDRPELQSVIGFLLQTHVLRTRLSGSMTFRELLARVQKGVLDLYDHRAVPFDQIVKRVQPERNLSYSPLFQVMINWRDRDQLLSFIGLEDLEVESLLAESRVAKFDLTLCLTDVGDEIWLEIEYSTDLFDAARIERLAGHFRVLLEGIAAEPGQRIGQLPLMTKPEEQQLLVGWNRKQADYPSDRCLHELIEEQVSRAPDATAVAFEDVRLTYRQLLVGNWFWGARLYSALRG